MPPSAIGRRRVRCPKCATLLTEPQTPIYECPECSTYLLAKGYAASNLSDKRLLVNGGDVEEAQKATDEGVNVEKASRSGDDGQPQRGESVKSREFEAEIAPQSDTHALSDLSNQTLAKRGLPKSGYVQSELSVGMYPEKSEKASHPSTRQSSDLDSDSHSECEADSPLWSPENAKASGASQVSSLVNGPEGLSFVCSSSESISAATSSYFQRQAKDDDVGKDSESCDMHQSLALDEHSTEEVSHNKEGDCRKKQSLVQLEQLPEELAVNKDANGASTMADDDKENRIASKTGFETALSDSVAEGTVERDEQQNITGTVQIFDLSVFGIYNKETYNELRRGKVAHYPSLAEDIVHGDNNLPPDGNESSSKVLSMDQDDLPSDKGFSGEMNHRNMLHIEKIIGPSESLVPDDGAISAGTVENIDTQVNVLHENTGTRSLDASLGETRNAGVGSLDDEKVLPGSDRDIDALPKARYGDDLDVRELSSESACVDISFGDWRSWTVSKSTNTALELDLELEEHKKGVVISATEEDTDSSWDDDDNLAVSSTANRGFKAEGTSLMDGNSGSLVSRNDFDESQAKITVDKPAFPLRTTAMQKLLKRDDQQRASQTQASESIIKSDFVIYEAPYVEHYSPRPLTVTREASDWALPPMPVQQDFNAQPTKEPGSCIEPLELQVAENETKLQRQNLSNAHVSTPVSMQRLDMLTGGDSAHREEDKSQAPHTDHMGPRKGFEQVAHPQEDGILWKTDSTGPETAELTAQKVDYINQLNQNTQENPAGASVSLKWEGKGSSIRSVSSAEDEGADRVEPDVGSGTEKDHFKEGSLASVQRPFSVKQGIDGSGQQFIGPAGRVSQRTRGSSTEANRQKAGSWEPSMSRRTARSRPSSESIANQGPLTEEGRVHAEKYSDSEASRWSGLGKRADQHTAYLGSGLGMGGPEQTSRYPPPGTIARDYSSDGSFHFQDIISHTHRVDSFPTSHGPSLNTSARASPLQPPSYGSTALTVSHEEGLSHPSLAHHGISPACSVCIQHQYLLQHSQMYQNMMPNQCAACAAQTSAAHKPMHHEVHGHHMHGLTHLNHALRHPDSVVSPHGPSRQNRSRDQNSHLNMLERRRKCHPPLPGKGAPPYVLCRHCDQLLKVPEYLSAISGSVQKLHCGSCGKISKFTISETDNHASWLSLMSFDRDAFVEMNERHIDTAHVYSSEQHSPGGFVPHPQNSFGKVSLLPVQDVQQGWIENRVTSHANAHAIQSDKAGHRKQTKPLTVTTGSEVEAYGSLHIGEKDASNDTGPFGEEYFSSSPSSASGASPRRISQFSQDKQQPPVPAMGRGSRGPKFGPDLNLRTSVNDKGISPRGTPRFSDNLIQKEVDENQSRASRTSLQGSTLEPFVDSPRYARMERYGNDPTSGSGPSEPADGSYSGLSSPRSHLEQVQKLAAAPGSPLVAHHMHGILNDLPFARHRQQQKLSGNGSRLSPKFESQASPPHDPHSYSDSGGRLFEDDRPRLPLQDSIKGPVSFTGLLKRSIKDLSKGGQGKNPRRVVVNGNTISEVDVRKAEERAGPIHSGNYWYDYQAGFWGVWGGPCLGIVMPFIEELNFPLARDCANGRTGILVNGRELHDRDLEVLAKRGLPTSSGKAYILDISGALFDDGSGQPLKGLGKLAPSIEMRGRGFGMSPSIPMG